LVLDALGHWARVWDKVLLSRDDFAVSEDIDVVEPE
jgi:hypothetical protein